MNLIVAFIQCVYLCTSVVECNSPFSSYILGVIKLKMLQFYLWLKYMQKRKMFHLTKACSEIPIIKASLEFHCVKGFARARHKC